MKAALRIVMFLASFASSFTIAQAGDMHDMDMKEMDMKGKNGMQMEPQSQKVVHEAQGIVKKIDTAGGLVTIAHGSVVTLNWQPMTMTFKVQNKSLLKKMEVGKTVEFSFVQQGDDYVVTGLKRVHD